ncbi:unnamed protein product [Meloidogyne enterolobii]|uniref:Uncharacterized protein n=1 Tax=Meloidogyne enterolobii TaxID=390850 RepID=A0ACB1A2T7_MELEN
MVHPVIFSASTILFLIKFPKIHSFLFFLLFSFNLYPSTLATQSSDDFQLFVTIFVILLIIGLVISAAFALSLYFYVWYKRRENVGKQSFNNLNEYYKQQQKQQHVVKPVKRREAENVFWTEVEL